MGLGSSNPTIVDVCHKKRTNAFCDANLKMQIALIKRVDIDLFNMM